MLSAILFAIGTAGVFVRRNLITILLSVEIMLNAVNLTLRRVRPRARHGRRPDHRVLRDDRGRRGSRGRPGDRDRPVPPPRVAEPGRSRAEMVTARVHRGHESSRRSDITVLGLSVSVPLSSSLSDLSMLLLIPLFPLVGFLLNASFGAASQQGACPARSRAAR